MEKEQKRVWLLQCQAQGCLGLDSCGERSQKAAFSFMGLPETEHTVLLASLTLVTWQATHI